MAIGELEIALNFLISEPKIQYGEMGAELK
jgi:hypothetical protein